MSETYPCHICGKHMTDPAGLTGDAWFCACKGTGKSPLCDGAHNKL